MSRRASDSPYNRFLGAQDPNERVDASAFFSPTCVYNHGSCGAPCGIKSNGQPYRKCDLHRLQHNHHQRRHVRNRDAARARPYRMRALNDMLGTAVDPLDDDQFLEQLAEEIDTPSPLIDTLPPLTELEQLYAETDRDEIDENTAPNVGATNEANLFDDIDGFLDALESPYRE